MTDKMKTISSTSKKVFFSILFLLQIFAKVWFIVFGRFGNISKQNKQAKILTSNVPRSKLLSKNIWQSVIGDFLDPESEQKMKKTSKQWSDVKIYENLFPNEREMVVFKNVNTEKIIWESIKFTELWDPLPNREELVSHLRRNDFAKWNDVFLWFVLTGDLDTCKAFLIFNKPQTEAILKALMLEIAENVAVGFAPRHGISPLMCAAAIDDNDSMLALIKRGAEVDQRDTPRRTALHWAAEYGHINASATLLENNANIDAANIHGWTPLMKAANFGIKNMFEFLIQKGAREDLTDNIGRTASQLASFEER